MTYQDVWLNGKCIVAGKRNCSDRYDIIKRYCIEWNLKEFSVLDIGANMCYFGLRLIEDFNCSVMAFEFHDYEMRLAHIKKNKTDKLLLLNKKINLPELKILNACCHFDLVLCMSVIHHVKDEAKEYVSELRKSGDHVILEIAGEDSRRAVDRQSIYEPENYTLLGYSSSHLHETIKRKIISL